MATNTLDQALANLRSGGLSGTSLQMAEQSLRNSYGTAPVAPAVAPTVAPTLPAPVTAGAAYKPFTAAGPTADDLFSDQLFKQASKDVLSGVPKEKDIYRQKLGLYQKEIDANNQIYAEQLRQAQTRGIGDFGSQRAIQSRSGLLGSDFAASQNSSVADANTKREALVQAEKAAALGAIMGKVRGDVATELAAKRAAYDKGLTETRAFLAERATRRLTYASGLAKQMLDSNIKFEDIDPSQLNNIAKQYGLSTADLLTAYKAEEKTRTDALKKEAFDAAKEQLEYDEETGTYKSTAPTEYETLSEGATLIDPETGEVIYTAPKTTEDDYDELLTVAEAKELGVPYGTTRGEAAGQGITPGGGEEKKDSAIAKSTGVLQTIDSALSGSNYGSAGFVGAQTVRIPGTPAYNLEKTIDTIKANLSFSELQAMRDASKTGGALGQVTERELDLLSAVVASLDIGQSPAQLKKNLEKIRTHYENALAALQGVELTD